MHPLLLVAQAMAQIKAHRALASFESASMCQSYPIVHVPLGGIAGSRTLHPIRKLALAALTFLGETG